MVFEITPGPFEVLIMAIILASQFTLYKTSKYKFYFSRFYAELLWQQRSPIWGHHRYTLVWGLTIAVIQLC